MLVRIPIEQTRDGIDASERGFMVDAGASPDMDIDPINLLKLLMGATVLYSGLQLFFQAFPA